VATRISSTEMSSTETRHTARAADSGGWTVSWLPGRTLTQNQAVTAMTIAEAVKVHADDLADNGSAWWLQIDGWASELGITGPHAVAEASLPPEEHQECHDAERDAKEDADDQAEALAAPDDGRGNGLLDLTRSERLGFINVMTPHEAKVLLAYIAGYAPEVFDAALLATRPETFAAELAARIETRDEAEYMAEPEGYCTVCGANASWFLGHDGPQHFRGPHKLVTGAERRELFTPDDGHAPQVAWRQSGGAS